RRAHPDPRRAVLRPGRARACARGLEPVQGSRALPGFLRAPHALVLLRAIAFLPPALVRSGPVLRQRAALPDVRARPFAVHHRRGGGPDLPDGTARGKPPGGPAGRTVSRRAAGVDP